MTVEVVSDGFFALGRDDYDLLNARGNRFLDDVLDSRPVNQGQQLFWHRLGDREKAGTKTRGWYNGFPYFHRHILQEVFGLMALFRQYSKAEGYVGIGIPIHYIPMHVITSHVRDIFC
jgi:hypothetical protein